MTIFRRLLHNEQHQNRPTKNDVTFTGNDVGPECSNGDPWLWTHMQQCVEGQQQFVGFVMGVVAIAIWIVIHALLLRIRTSEYARRKSSSTFLVLLHCTVPDCLCLGGAILARQLTTQILLAAYLVLADLCFWTFFGFVKLYQSGSCCFRTCKKNNKKYEKDRNSNNLVFMSPFIISFIYLASFGSTHISSTHLQVKSRGLPLMTHRTRILLHASHDDDDGDGLEVLIPQIGYGLGLAAILFTWSALIHQSHWVFQEKKMPKAFHLIHVLMIIADISYLTSVFTQSVETGFIMHTLPWTFTRIGTMGLNFGILFQACLNTRQRLAGREINEDVAILLRSKETTDGQRESDDDDEEGSSEDCPLLEVPKKNKYIRKMRRMARQIEQQNKGQVSEDELFSDDDDMKKSVFSSQSDQFQLELDLTDETLNYELSSEEVYNLLAAEDRQETTVTIQRPKIVFSKIDPGSDGKGSVHYFHEDLVEPSSAHIEEDGKKSSSMDYHQTVFVDESFAST